MLPAATTIDLIGAAAAGIPFAFGLRFIWDDLAERLSRMRRHVSFNEESLEPAALIEAAIERMSDSGGPGDFSIDMRTRHTCKLRGDAGWLVTAIADVLGHAMHQGEQGHACEAVSITCCDSQRSERPFVMVRVLAHGTRRPQDAGLRRHLATTEQIINAHGGQLAIAFSEARTEFRLLLPAALSRSCYQPQWPRSTLARIGEAQRQGLASRRLTFGRGLDEVAQPLFQPLAKV